MINIKEKKLILELDEKGSSLLTSAISCLIAFKKDNLCKKIDCEDCKSQGNNLREQDYEKLAKEILDLYYDMYKISMSTTKIPTLKEVRDSIIPLEIIKK